MSNSLMIEKIQLLLKEQQRLQKLLHLQKSSAMPRCNNCGSANLLQEGKFQDNNVDYIVNNCLDCGLVQLETPLPVFEQSSLEDTNPHYDPPPPEEIEAQVEAHSFIVDLIHQFRAGRRLLDVGCSNGYKLEAARRCGWDVEGIEISTRAYNFARIVMKLPIHQGTLETYIPANGRFDAIVAWHVLEHVPSVHAFLSHIHLLLNPAGHFFVQVPSYSSYKTLAPWNDHPEMFTPVHSWFLTRASLIQLLLENDLEIVKTYDDTNLRNLTVIAKRRE